MREVGLILMAVLATSTAEANELGAAIDKAGPDASMFFYCLIAIFVICAIGLMANVILSLFDESKFLKIINKATFLGAAGVLVIMATGFIGIITKAVFTVIRMVSG